MHPLVTAVRRRLEQEADAERAAPMQAYMKSLMPYWGVPLPRVRAIAREVFDAHPLDSPEAWREAVLALFREAGHREERYAALELAALRRYAKYETLDALPMYEELIVTGAWWDLVDGVAQNRVGSLLQRHPETMTPIMRRWSRDPDLWKRRTSIICQNKRKQSTDQALLFDCIGANLADKDFFIRKAIGWALRAYAYTAPGAVVRYVRDHTRASSDAAGPVLSGLSRREAQKHLGGLDEEVASIKPPTSPPAPPSRGDRRSAPAARARSRRR